MNSRNATKTQILTCIKSKHCWEEEEWIRNEGLCCFAKGQTEQEQFLSIVILACLLLNISILLKEGCPNL